MRSPRPFQSSLAAISLLGSLLWGCSKEHPPGLESVETHPDGYWQDTRFPQGTGVLDESARRQLERLANLGYTEGSEPAPIEVGVGVYHKERAENGLNLYCSGHAPEAVLMDMQGQELHRWHLAFDQVPSKRTPELRTQLTWRKVKLLERGDLLVCYEGLGLARIDRASKLIWYWDGAAHHDFEVRAERVYTLAREGRHLPYLRNAGGVVEDFLCELDLETGAELARHSLYGALFESRWSGTLVQRSAQVQDILHTNSIEPVSHALAARFHGASEGDWLLVFRDVNALAILSAKDAHVVWYQEGPWKGPHSASSTPSGNILLFDNMGFDGFTRLVEWDPISQAIVWAHHGTPASDFVSIFSGNVHRLPGGNLLVSLSCAGKAQELTPPGEVVWEFHSPHRAGKRNELVAVLFDVERLAPESVQDWLKLGK